MNNKLSTPYLCDRRPALLGKAGLLALAMTIAPLALTTHGVARVQANAANDLLETDDPATEIATDDNGTDATDTSETGTVDSADVDDGIGGDNEDGDNDGGDDGGDGGDGGDGAGD